jgi:hypothetical protein
MNIRTWVLAAALALLAASPVSAERPHLVPLTPEEAALKAALGALVRQEDEAVLSGDVTRLKAVFAPGEEGRSALHWALKRRAFVTSWTAARGVTITGVQVSVRTPHIAFDTPARAVVAGVVSERYDYRYAGLPAAVFGIGIRHDYVLRKEADGWRIESDHFTDPLDQDTRIPVPARPAEGSLPPPGAAPGGDASPAALRAVAYAERYCGAAPGCGNDGFYNPDYVSYNGEGGDCTNFVSQTLAAGGFREVDVWSYDRRTAEGSHAWTNARGRFDFLEASGRADIFARGRLPDVTRPSDAAPRGAVYALRPGDLVSYVEHGKAVHTAVVVGTDPHGVPVVDTHTADRFHVPWDLGWDQSTYYVLWHVHYPRTGSGALPGAS